MLLWLGVAWAGCDVSKVVAGAEAVAATKGDARLMHATRAFGDACHSVRLGREVWELANFGAGEAGIMEMKITAENPARWLEVCGGAAGLRAAAEMGAMVETEGRDHVWKACHLQKTGWMTEAEWRTARGLVFLPFMVGAELNAAGADAKSIRVLVRALAGLHS